jgi:uncharacterized protein YkwD
MRNALALAALLFVAMPVASDDNIDLTRASLREEMVRIINRDRKQFGMQPVQLDYRISDFADAYCRAQIRNGTTGHFTIDGQSPYMRYSFAGGSDAVSENAAAWSAPYHFNERSVYQMMRNSEETMMLEVAPHDGHRRTILDPYATHVGIGLAWDGGEFRMTQEFVRRYVDFTRAIPRSTAIGERVLCTGRPRDGYSVQAITVHHEPAPQPIAAGVANLIESYALPEKRHEYVPRLDANQEYSDGRRGDFSIGKDGRFAFAVPFTDGGGVYTVVVWVRHNGDSLPIAASNVSIRVDAPRGVIASRREAAPASR